MNQLTLFPELADIRPAPEIPLLFTEREVVADLASRIRKQRCGQGRVASELRLSQGAISNVLTQGRSIGPKVAQALGYRKVIRYERVE